MVAKAVGAFGAARIVKALVSEMRFPLHAARGRVLHGARTRPRDLEGASKAAAARPPIEKAAVVASVAAGLGLGRTPWLATALLSGQRYVGEDVLRQSGLPKLGLVGCLSSGHPEVPGYQNR